MESRKENERHKIYYCGQREIIPEKRKFNADGTCGTCRRASSQRGQTAPAHAERKFA